jgi:hypothetical protein
MSEIFFLAGRRTNALGTAMERRRRTTHRFGFESKGARTALAHAGGDPISAIRGLPGGFRPAAMLAI